MTLTDSRPGRPPSAATAPEGADVARPGPAGGREPAVPGDPRAAADRDIAAFLGGRRPDLVFFFGYGDGRYAEALRRRTAAPVIVYEPADVRAADAPAPPAGVTVVETLAGLRAAVADRADLSSGEVLAGAAPALRAARPELFARFVEAVKQARVDAGIRRATVARSGAGWLTHLAANLPQVAAMPVVDVLAGRFAACPGILVGAGPSLDRNLDALARLQGRAVLCAASTALPALARAGIVPELVVAIEGNDLSVHFAGIPHLDRMTLLPGPLSHPAHFAVPVGSRLALAPKGSVAGDWLQRARGCRQLDCGGSVACAGFSALHLAGCDPLVLVGMDLALTEGRTHAGGTEQAARRVRWEPEAGRVYHWFEDKDATGYWQATTTAAWGGGGQVLTRPVFNSFRLWFEGAAETWARDRALVNATEGGARIHGFVESTLAAWAAARDLPALDARAVIDRAIAAAPPPDPGPVWREVAAELGVVAAAAAAAAEADRLAARALRDLQARRHGGLDALLARLGAAEARLGRLTRATRLLNTLVGERSLSLAREAAPGATADPAAATAWSLRQSRRLCGAVADGARELAALYGPLAALAGNGADTGREPAAACNLAAPPA